MSTTPRCAVNSRYSPKSATVSAAKILPLPPASTSINTPLKISTPSIDARIPSGRGSRSTVQTNKRQAIATHNLNDVSHEAPRTGFTVSCSEVIGVGIRTIYRSIYLSSPTLNPGCAATRRTPKSTPGMKDARSKESWRIVKSCPGSPSRIS